MKQARESRPGRYLDNDADSKPGLIGAPRRGLLGGGRSPRLSGLLLGLLLLHQQLHLRLRPVPPSPTPLILCCRMNLGGLDGPLKLSRQGRTVSASFCDVTFHCESPWSFFPLFFFFSGVFSVGGGGAGLKK